MDIDTTTAAAEVIVESDLLRVLDVRLIGSDEATAYVAATIEGDDDLIAAIIDADRDQNDPLLTSLVRTVEDAMIERAI